MATNSYNAIVLGDDFAGVVAATLCASRGLRVLLAATSRRPTSYTLGPYQLPIRPLTFAGLGSPAVQRVVDELNFGHLLKRRMRENEPPFQFVGPDARIDVSADDDALSLALARDLGGAGAQAATAGSACARALSDLLDPVLNQPGTFPPTKFRGRRELGRLADQIDRAAQALLQATSAEPTARALIAAPAALSSHAAPTSLCPLSLGRAFEHWRRGTGRLAGGYDSLRSIFLDKFTSHTGEVREVDVDHISVAWGKASGIVLRDGEELGADHIIAAMPVAELSALLAKPPKRLLEAAAAVRPTAYRYTLNLIVAESGVPQGLGPAALIVADPSQPLIGDNAIALHLSEPDDQARVRVSVEALCAAPADGAALSDRLSDLRIRLRERLEDVMPFSRDHTLLVHSPHEATRPEGTDAKPSLPDPVAPHPVWTTEGDGHFGLSGLPYQLGLKRLTNASSQILPELGLEGEFAVGWSAAELAGTTGKKRDYLRNEIISAETRPRD